MEEGLTFIIALHLPKQPITFSVVDAGQYPFMILQGLDRLFSLAIVNYLQSKSKKSSYKNWGLDRFFNFSIVFGFSTEVSRRGLDRNFKIKNVFEILVVGENKNANQNHSHF